MAKANSSSARKTKKHEARPQVREALSRRESRILANLRKVKPGHRRAIEGAVVEMVKAAKRPPKPPAPVEEQKPNLEEMGYEALREYLEKEGPDEIQRLSPERAREFVRELLKDAAESRHAISLHGRLLRASNNNELPRGIDSYDLEETSTKQVIEQCRRMADTLFFLQQAIGVDAYESEGCDETTPFLRSTPKERRKDEGVAA